MGAVEVGDFDGERAALGGEEAAGGEVVLERGGLEGGGHYADAEVGAVAGGDLEGAGEGDVAEEVAFVEFVEEDGGDFGEGGVFEHLAKEDAFGDEFDAGAGGGDVVEADLVADFFAEGDAAFGGDAGGEHAGGEAAGLEDDDLAVAAGAGVEEDLGDLGGFSGSGGGFEDDAFIGAEGVGDFGGEVVDGKRGQGILEFGIWNLDWGREVGLGGWEHFGSEFWSGCW